ncbi:MAG: iron chelate uptake ABC transporter family permease subunit, partial [Phycisphaeraceae bacterium]
MSTPTLEQRRGDRQTAPPSPLPHVGWALRRKPPPRRRRAFFVLLMLFVLLALVAAARLLVGEQLPLNEAGEIDWVMLEQYLLLRRDRLLIGLTVGAALAISGTLLQSLLRNPLASPYILGLSSGAAL